MENTIDKLMILVDEEHRNEVIDNDHSISLSTQTDLGKPSILFDIDDGKGGRHLLILLTAVKGDAVLCVTPGNGFLAKRDILSDIAEDTLIGTDKPFTLPGSEIHGAFARTKNLRLGPWEEVDLVSSKAAFFIYQLATEFELIVDEEDLESIADHDI
jgi:hypothetical protein